MRSRVLGLLVAALALFLIPVAADAGHRDHGYHHHRGGWVGVSRPFYHRHYRSDFYPDPYAYYASPRRYYPYYNSGHWRPTRELRYRRDCCRPVAALPPYYQAWGYPRRHYYKRTKWHHRHHGYHHRRHHR
jgi:hypothetical protein